MSLEKMNIERHRPAMMADAKHAIGLINAHSNYPYGADRLAAHELDGGFDKCGTLRQRNMEIWFDTDERLEAFVGLWGSQWPTSWDVWLDATVHPSVADKRRLWDELLAWSEEHATSLFEASDRNAGILCGSRVLATDDVALAAHSARGYKRGITETLMRGKLEERSLHNPQWSKGTSCRVLNLGDDLEAYAVALDESYREEAGYIPLSREDAIRARHDEFESFGDDYKRDLWFVAVDGNEIVGGVGNFLNHGGKPERSYLYHVFVRPNWRGQGIATALLRQSFQAVHRCGVRFAELHVNSRNTTGALALYESVGMEPVWHQHLYEKKLRVT